MRPHLPPIPPGNFCKPFASSPSSSVDHGVPAEAAALLSRAFCSSRFLASSRCLAFSTSSAARFWRHSASSDRTASRTALPESASTLTQRFSNCSASSDRDISCSSSASMVSRDACVHLRSRCLRVLVTCLFCFRCSRSSRSFSSRSAFSFSSCRRRSSISLCFASSSSCFIRARLAFSSAFLASFSSRSSLSRGSNRSAASTRRMMRRRSSTSYFFRIFWFCRSIQRRSSRISASSRLYSSCIEKSRHDSKLNQKS
mmetsp:Transcript_63381/g.137976  ORF Transcript_63381/g.137976 Transcript_63381/m.137976 type:complete len:257 (+) Transcript_63381:544-1314(+)